MAGNPSLFPEQANTTLNRLNTLSERMINDWGTIKAEIASLTGQLGKGELGAAFLAGYRQLATDIIDAVDQCCRRPSEFAAVGNHSVAGLTTMDDDNQQKIQSHATPPT